MEPQLPYSAIILDLDGVITDTRELHFDSWKEAFDDVLDEKETFGWEDYNLFVDGRPREEGIRSFLSSRKIKLSADALKKLSARKNKLYLNRLRSQGPRVYEDSVRALRHWKERGVPLAVVSSSKNCSEVLEKAGVEELFEVKIDPFVAEEKHLRGKPEADTFVEAARQLGLEPEECAVVEDSLAGITAGVRGHFKSVIGMSRPGQTPPSKLYAEGATLVVDSLEKIGPKENALTHWDELLEVIGDREIALFLDFDGTMSELVADPAKAKLRPGLQPLLEECSRSLKMAVVTGRDRQDVKNRINVPGLFYAGCHGFVISGPGGFHFEVEEAQAIMPHLLSARELLEPFVTTFPGCTLEHKKFFTAIHYRNVDPALETKLKTRVHALVGTFADLETREGKKVIEVAPRIEWGKGHAIRKLCEVLEIDERKTVPLYLGDDVTDEDAFREFKGRGIGIKVGEENLEKSAADFCLADPSEVEEFLRRISAHFVGRDKKWRPGT